ERLLQVAIAENLDASTGRNHAGLGQRFRRKGAFAEFRQALEIHDGILLAENIGEAALGDTAMQRHLPAFKAAHHARAGAGTLAFVAAGGSLAHAAAHAASYALGLFGGAAGTANGGKIHNQFLAFKFKNTQTRESAPHDYATIF